jgi:hypothetical protein
VCDPLNDNATIVVKDAAKGNYAVSETRWYCYEDFTTLSKKVKYSITNSSLHSFVWPFTIKKALSSVEKLNRCSTFLETLADRFVFFFSFLQVELVNQFGAAGMFVVGVSYDDINNHCGCGDFGITRMTAELMRANDGCSFTPCI